MALCTPGADCKTRVTLLTHPPQVMPEITSVSSAIVNLIDTRFLRGTDSSASGFSGALPDQIFGIVDQSIGDNFAIDLEAAAVDCEPDCLHLLSVLDV